jgi:hypothetical protein
MKSCHVQLDIYIVDHLPPAGMFPRGRLNVFSMGITGTYATTARNVFFFSLCFTIALGLRIVLATEAKGLHRCLFFLAHFCSKSKTAFSPKGCFQDNIVWLVSTISFLIFLVSFLYLFPFYFLDLETGRGGNAATRVL